MGLSGRALASIEERGECCAERDAVIGSSRLDENIVARFPAAAILPLAFELSATPPARQRFLLPVFCKGQAHHVEHRGFTQVLHRVGDVLVKIVDLAFRFARAAKLLRPACVRIAPGAVEKIGVGLVRSGVNVEKHTQIHARLAVGSEAHHFPFIGVRNKAEEAGEHCVKQPERVRPIDREDRVDAAFRPMPDGSRLPRATAVHHHDGSIVKAGIRIGTERMSEMVIHETKPRFRGTELALERISASILMPHAERNDAWSSTRSDS